MALFCVWTRRACSHYVVLGQPIPPDSRLESHMASCSECREYWNDLRMLTTDLDRLVTVPLPSAQYAEPIWERVKPISRAPQWGRLSLVGAAACGLLCGLAWWKLGHFAPQPSPLSNKVIAAIKPPAGDPAPPLNSANTTQETQPSVTPAITGPANRSPLRHLVKWSSRRNRNRSEYAVHRWRHGSPATIPLRESELPVNMRASGLIYESEGDPGLANVAYQAAYQQHPSEEIAFDMGRTAEESGDMEQAMNVYAGLLESADAKARDQKGWTP